MIKIETSDKRIETGVIQFGNDWPGVFFRGKHALTHAFNLEQYIKITEDKVSDEILLHYVKCLVEELNKAKI